MVEHDGLCIPGYSTSRNELQHVYLRIGTLLPRTSGVRWGVSSRMFCLGLRLPDT